MQHQPVGLLSGCRWLVLTSGPCFVVGLPIGVLRAWWLGAGW